MQAIRFEHHDIAKYLLDQNADVDIQDKVRSYHEVDEFN